MTEIKQKTFLNERLTFRLEVLADEAIASNEQVFLDTLGCGIREIRVLRLIDDLPGITFIEIVAAAHLERSLASRIIQKLLGMDLIERRASAEDARRHRLYATEAGRALRLRGRALADRLEAHLTAPLTPEESATLSVCLEKLALWVRSDEYKRVLEGERSGP